MSKVIMIQGTMSNVGKSVLCGGLCRIFRQDGLKTAPFKSQNMALNSFITRDGLEMGRAQVMQAEAAGIEPSADMNPILLKPVHDAGSQVIVNGNPIGTMPAAEYYRRKKEFIPAIREAYGRLEERFDAIVIEGAGSPAEINLMENDIVNMGLAEMVDAPVLLVGDIDRGGVFAQLKGTVDLLEEGQRKRIKGLIINKFRGDVSILEPGLAMLEEKTGIAVLGVVPYFYLDIDEEDSLTERFRYKPAAAQVDIAVVRFPHISNFTDFAPLEAQKEQGMAGVRYITRPDQFANPDAVILPGTKNTAEDLLWLRQSGLEAKILQFAARGGTVLGICGGFQMLGHSVCDPEGAETKMREEVRGLGLLDVRTVFRQEKHRTRVRGSFKETRGTLSGLSGVPFVGYEIHMGETYPAPAKEDRQTQESAEANRRSEVQADANRRSEETAKEDWLTEKPVKAESLYTAKPEKSDWVYIAESLQAGADLHVEKTGKTSLAGAQKGNVYGCYIHGLFDRPEVTEGFLKALLHKKGLDDGSVKGLDWRAHKEEQYDRLADILRESLDMEAIYRILGD